MWTPRRPDPVADETADADPVTDPFGFPPVPPVVGPVSEPSPPSSWAGWGPPSSPDTSAAPSPDLRGDVAAGWGASIQATGWAAWSAPVTEAPASRPATTPGADGHGPAAAAPPVPVTTSPCAETATPTSDPVPAAVPTTAAATPAPDPAEAAALAAAFAADYLSWDEDDPERRGRALATHLPGPRADRALLGWSGQGRQRTEMVLPGRVTPDGDGRVVVDVRVRVTPYRRVDQRGPGRPETDPDELLGEPAAAPPATARGWRGLASRWVRLGVAVVLDGDELVVDAGEAHPADADRQQDDGAPSPLSIAALRGGAR
ncbi:hypothetical protein EV383_0581 [Pseudonocardia sediminis]|uniref:Uncharacterized protein n=1 Tax=Pseudonocardia sediminis TaxID=1397368 RepID=A0A4Q7UUP8_PSEST|nr:hypothetical protein EV383_0581 [Pseudonocardia sediminis]